MNARHIELIACLHNAQHLDALIYVRVGSGFFRLCKKQSSPVIEYVTMPNRQACSQEARDVTRYAPHYALYDSINNAPLSQLQLERMILKLQAMGHLNREQQQKARF
jgi:hypothetical protein